MTNMRQAMLSTGPYVGSGRESFSVSASRFGQPPVSPLPTTEGARTVRSSSDTEQPSAGDASPDGLDEGVEAIEARTEAAQRVGKRPSADAMLVAAPRR